MEINDSLSDGRTLLTPEVLYSVTTIVICGCITAAQGYVAIIKAADPGEVVKISCE